MLEKVLRGNRHVTHQIVVVLEVDEVLLGEQSTEGRESKSVSLVSTKLHHVDDVGRGEVESARDLRVKAGESTVESVVGESSGDSASDGTTAGNVGVGAGGVGSARVVHVGVLDEDLNVDLVEVLWDTEETSGEVLGSLDHAVLGLSAEHRESLLGGAEKCISNL